MAAVLNYTTNINGCSSTKSFSWSWDCCNDWHRGTGRPILFKFGGNNCCANMSFGKSFLAGLGGGLGWGLGNMFGGGFMYPMSSCCWMC